jgi:hypothetical protein
MRKRWRGEAVSATGRSPVRLAQDVYPTPGYCVDKLLPWLDLNGRDGEPLMFFEPCRGDGAIYDRLPAEARKGHCEIREGTDYLATLVGRQDIIMHATTGGFSGTEGRGFWLPVSFWCFEPLHEDRHPRAPLKVLPKRVTIHHDQRDTPEPEALYERFTVTYPGGTVIESFYAGGRGGLLRCRPAPA